MLELLAVCERFGLADLERAHGAATLEALEASRLVTVVTSGRRTAAAAGPPAVRRGAPRRTAAAAAAPHPRSSWPTSSRPTARGDARTSSRSRSGGSPPAAGCPATGCCAPPGWRSSAATRRSPVRLVDAIAGRRGGRRPANAPRCSSRRTPLQGRDDEVERRRRRGLGRAARPTPSGPTSPAASPTPASTVAGTSTAPSPPTRRRGERLTDPEQIAAVDARRASLLAGAGRPAEALRIADSIGTPVTRADAASSWPRRGPSACSASVAATRRPRRPPGRRRPRRPARVARPPWHRPAPRQRGPRARLLRALRARRASCSSRRPTGARPPTRWARGCGSRWRSPRSPATPAGPGGDPPVPGRRRRGPSAGQDAALVWAHVGVAQGHLLLGECGPAAAALRRADEVGESPVATSVATRERTRAWLDACRGDLAAARVPHPRCRRQRATRPGVHLRGERAPRSGPARRARRGGRPAGGARRPGRRPARARPMPAHARAAVERDVDPARRRRSTATRRSTCWRYAAEAAAELAELHRAGPRLGWPPRPQQRSAEPGRPSGRSSARRCSPAAAVSSR